MGLRLTLPIDRLFSLIDFLGVFFGALGGALAAVRDTRYNYDLVGVTGLATVSALGGGIMRDLIVQQGAPLAFADERYLMIALIGAALGMLFARQAGRKTERAIIFVDAVALGLFAVAGSTRAIHAGLSWLPALLLGVTTAVGGGCLRDVLSGRTPRIFERGELYAIPAALSAAAYLACRASDVPRQLATVAGVLSGFTLRMLAMKFHWETRPIRRDVSEAPKP